MQIRRLQIEKTNSLELEKIIKGCIRQNRRAQEELFNRYKSVFYSLSLKYCANADEAEDNLHNGFIEIFTNIKKFDYKGSFEGWMKRIVINKAIDSYKRSFHLVPIKDDYVGEIMASDDELDIPMESILAMVQELPNQYRLVFCLFELDDYSHHEIAQLLSISEGTSKSNLHKAKVILKEKIKSKHPFHQYRKSNGK